MTVTGPGRLVHPAIPLPAYLSTCLGPPRLVGASWACAYVYVCECLYVCVHMCVSVYWGTKDRGFLTVGRLGGAREVAVGRVAVAGDDDRLLHHVDAVALHQILKEVEDFLGPGALERKYP